MDCSEVLNIVLTMLGEDPSSTPQHYVIILKHIPLLYFHVRLSTGTCFNAVLDSFLSLYHA